MTYRMFLGEPVTDPPAPPPSSSGNTDVRSPTRTEVRSPTRTATEVRSPTSTSTEAYTQGNFTVTVTGGAGSGDTAVDIHAPPLNRANSASSKGPRTNAQENRNVNAPRPDEDARNASGAVGMTPAQAAGFPNFVTDVPVQGPTDRGLRAADCYYTKNMLPANPAGCANEGTVPMWAKQSFVAPRHFPGIVGERLYGGGVGFALGAGPEVWTGMSPEQQTWVMNTLVTLDGKIRQGTGTSCPTFGPSITAAGQCFQGWFNANMKGMTKADGSALVLPTNGVFDQDTLDALRTVAALDPTTFPTPFPGTKLPGLEKQKEVLSKGAMIGIAVGGAAAVGGLVMILSKKKKRS